MLACLLTRAKRPEHAAAERALARASGGAGAPSVFAPVASLLDGPRSGAALELLTVVAALRDDGGGGAAEEEEEAREAEAEWGRVATFGSPLQTWDGVDANGGRAADLMYGVMMSAAMDPAAAALPACLVRDSVE